jgi:hypothetical protein
MNYEIVEYTADLKSQVLQLQTHLWGPEISANADYFKWKYEQNPYLERPLIHLALCAGKVVGMRGVYGAKWQTGHPGEFFHAPCVADFVIAPEHRCRGLFTRIIAAGVKTLGARGYPYVFSLSANSATRIGSLLMGWRSIGHLMPMRWRRWSRIIPGRFQKHAARLASSGALKQGNVFHFLDTARRFGELSRFVSVEQAPQPRAMAEFVARIAGDGRLRHVRDQGYFAWRFANPRAVYRFLFWTDLRMEGYLILQAKLYKDKAKINIVDCEATSMRVRADLLEAVIKWGNFAELNIWSAPFSAETKTLLNRAGFELLKDPASTTGSYPAILAKALHEGAPNDGWIVGDRRLSNFADWDLRMIYSDSY